MIDKIYVAECYAENVNVEFYINDIPLTIKGPGFGNFLGAPINQYLINKTNKISMIIRPGDTPARAKSGPVTGTYLSYSGVGEKAMMRICSYPKGSVVGGPEGEELLRLSWPEKRLIRKNVEISDYALNNYPMVKEEKFSIGRLFGMPKAYQKASGLRISDTIKLSLSKFLEELHGCIEKGDADKFIALTSFRIHDNAISYDKNINENIDLIRAGFKHNLGSKTWKLSGLDPQSYDFRLCFDNRMIHCIAKDWKPIIREMPDKDGSCAYYDIFVSLIKRRWQVVL